MEWLGLLLVGLVYTIGAYLSYGDEFRQKWWFIPVCTVLGTISGTMWFIMVKLIDDKQRIYVYSLMWDMVMMSIYYLFPLLFLGVKLDKWSIFGLCLMICGLTIIKVRAV